MATLIMRARRKLLSSVAPSGVSIINGLAKQATPGVNVGASQGVATDGTWFFTTGNDGDQREIRIFNSGWSEQVAIKVSAELDEPGLAQVNGMYCDRAAGKLYVGANNFPTTPALGWVLEYNIDAGTGALTFVASRSVGAIWCEGCTRHDGKFWVHHHGAATIHRYTAAWALDTVLAPLFSPAYSGGYYQGAFFRNDDVLYLNKHGSSGGGLDPYLWDRVNDRLIWTLASIAPPTDCTQGVDLSGGDLYMAERTANSIFTANNVVRASFTSVAAPPLYIGGGLAEAELGGISLTLPSYTAPAGANRFIVFKVSWEQAATPTQEVNSVTFGGVSATRIATYFNPGAGATHNGLSVWYMLAADIPAGAQNIVATMNVSVGNDLVLEAAVFQGVLQSAAAIESYVQANAGTVDVTTTAASRTAVNLFTNGSLISTPDNGQIKLLVSSVSEFVGIVAAKSALNAATYTFGWSGSAGLDRPISVGFALAPV